MAKTSRKKQKSSWFVRIFMICFFCAVSFGIYRQAGTYRQLQYEKNLLLEQIAEEERKAVGYENKKEYYNSDSYIEQVAREQLGLVKPNEILYINRDS